MPPFLKLFKGSTTCCLLCLNANLFFLSIAAAQKTGDTTQRHFYFSFTFLTGGGIQFFGKKSGMFTVSFPYTTTDASGVITSGTFSAQNKNIFGSARPFLAPLAVEMGGQHDFAHLEFSFFLGKGISTLGWRSTIGYGKICYIGRVALKFSLNFLITSDPRQGGYPLGSIDNHNKTVNILGWESDPTFLASDGRSGQETYHTNNVQITYSQHELSFMPKLSLLSRSRFRKNHFELAIGYNIPVQDRGGLNLVQQGSYNDDNESNVIPGPNIINHSLSAYYNNRPLKAPLYRYGGWYLELRRDILDWKKF